MNKEVINIFFHITLHILLRVFLMLLLIMRFSCSDKLCIIIIRERKGV